MESFILEMVVVFMLTGVYEEFLRREKWVSWIFCFVF